MYLKKCPARVNDANQTAVKLLENIFPAEMYSNLYLFDEIVFKNICIISQLSARKSVQSRVNLTLTS
jgi:hypothetical protein